MPVEEISTITAAAAAAGRNLEANLRHLALRQPELAREVSAIEIDAEWLFARDGSLTAMTAADGWWSGCSLPRRAAEAILRKMELKSTVACFLSPTHAAQVRVTLDRMTPGQALIAVVPDARELRVMLGCEAFADEIAAARLHFACGENWADGLEGLLRQNEGLPTPGQFIRTALVAEEVIAGMVSAGQTLFAQENQRRAEVVKALFADAPKSDDVCVVAPGQFRLWEDVGGVLGDLARRERWHTLDPDDPASASPVAFARAVAGRGVLVVANVGRADLPAELPETTRVVTWLTGPRVPAFTDRSRGDALLLADARWRDAAVGSGWPADRVIVASWPAPLTNAANAHGTRSVGSLAIIADTVSLATPEFELSSQRVLWDTIVLELADDPFAAGDDAGEYLGRWLARAGMSAEAADRARFIDGLIVPAYQQGLARWLISAGVKLKLYGRGWDGIAEFAGHHAGEVRDRAELRAAAEGAKGLVFAWPSRFAHPIDALGRPVLRRGFKGKEMWIAEARRLARGEGGAESCGAPELSGRVIRKVVGLVE